MKFKVGQRVKIIRPVPTHINNYLTCASSVGTKGIIGAKNEDGKTMQIERCGDETYYPITYNDNWGWITSDYITLLTKEIKMKDVKFGIKFETDEDPVEFFKTQKEAEKRIQELLEDSEVKKNEIYMFEIKNLWQVSRPVSFKLVDLFRKVKKEKV